MEGLLTKAAAGLAVINVGVLVWLNQVPMPPDHIPPVEEVADPGEGLHDVTAPEVASRDMAILDGILAERLVEEATARGVTPALPEQELRAEAAVSPPDSDPALRLLAAYAHAFADLGLSLDGAAL